jgi:thiol-disulfide isomerase/thioredoxin
MTRLWQGAAVAMVVLVVLGTPMARAADPPSGDASDVPEGNPTKLMAFMQGLMRQKPQDEQTQNKMRQALAKAADRILDGKPTKEQLLFAVRIKAVLLQDAQELTALEEKMTKAGQKVAARLVHMRLLGFQIERAGNEAAIASPLGELKELLGAEPLQPGDAESAQQLAELIEKKGYDRLAGETYESMAKLIAADQKQASVVRQMQACARRLKLVGNSMLLEGKTLDGKELEWGKYRGKVVLIDFWATWCGPCRAEIPNIKASYEKYQGQGFEVIGISLDHQKRSSELAEFVKDEQVPWTICRDDDSRKHMADYYGIQSIPQMMLVGRDGKVITLRARGSALGRLVEQALAAPGGAVEVAKNEDLPALADEKEAKKAEKPAVAKNKPEPAAKAVQARTWTDASGKFQVTAKFRGMSNKIVKLELEDGRVISLPLQKLSDDDQECIRERKY